MQNTFDFGTIAREYDAYYQSDFGKKVDRLEKLIIEQFLSKLHSKNILEIGCGTGHWTEFLAQKGFIVEGIDISEKMLHVAQSKNIKNATFRLGDILHPGRKDESADNIIAVTSLEFTGNLNKAFENIYKTLKKGGCFICAGLNGSSPFWNDKLNDPVYKNADFFTVEKLKNLLKPFGTIPVFKAGVITENNIFCDEKYSEKDKLSKGAFIAAFVQKQ